MPYENNFICIVIEIIKKVVKESFEIDELVNFFIYSNDNDPKFRFIISFFKAFEQ
jgi:hypothetical protein